MFTVKIDVANSVAMMKKMLFINIRGFGPALVALCIIPLKVGLSASHREPHSPWRRQLRRRESLKVV